MVFGGLDQVLEAQDGKKRITCTSGYLKSLSYAHIGLLLSESSKCGSCQSFCNTLDVDAVKNVPKAESHPFRRRILKNQ